MTMSELVWDKPSPGSWELDAGHQPTPFGRYVDDAALEQTNLGLAESFARAGIPLRTVECASVNGWWYTAVRPLGGPPEGGGPPPRWVLRVLFALHPELRRRRRNARLFFEDEVAAKMFDEWEQVLRPPLARRAAATAARARRATDLDDAALATSIATTTALLRDLNRAHFSGVVATAIPTGDFLVHTERWASAPPRQSIAALSGYTPATVAPRRALDAIVEALRERDALGLLDGERPVEVFAAIEALGGAAAQTLADYRDDYGVRICTGYSVLDQTLDELPELLLATLRQRRSGGGDDTAARTQADATAAGLRERVATAHRNAWDAMLALARRSTHRREDEGGLLLKVTGIARRLLLETGRRLVERDRMDEAVSACDLTEAELVALLSGTGPTRGQIAAHTQQRRAFAAATPPDSLGPASARPPVEVFPVSMRRTVAAAFAYISRFKAGADPVEAEGIAGVGVSPGVVTGRACIVRDAADFSRFQRGDILVAHSTAPAFNTLLTAAAGVVTEQGGLVSHAAIVAREFGIPGVVGVSGALAAIPDGAQIRVDGDRGSIEILRAQMSPPLTSAIDDVPEQDVPRARVPATPGDIVPLGDAADAERFGGKASGLAHLTRGSVAVPWGIALCVDAVQGVCAGDQIARERLEAALGTQTGPFAVRSSATAEDSRAASYAGQFHTDLAVSRGDVASALETVRRSAHAPSVRAYRERIGATGAVGMAAVVQSLVAADVAGVLFFRGEGERHVVEATWGFGQTLVEGAVVPDRFEIDDDGQCLARALGSKQVEAVLTPDGLQTRSVATERAERSCLDDDQLRQLADLGRETRRIFGDARDIEWAFAGGRLHCLQARPLTRRLPTPADLDPA
jgi:pyruvate,water dikinase